MENKKNNLDTKTSATIIIGVLVCFFMIAVYAITNYVKPSYALPTDVVDASKIDEVTSSTSNLNGMTGYTPANTQNWYNLYTKFSGKAKLNDIDYTIDMFCLEILKEMPNESKYTKLANSSAYIDEGISYIVNTAYKNAKLNDTTKEITLDTEAYYNAQLAIWIYQELKNPNKEATGDDATTIKTINDMWADINQNHTTGAAKAIYEYVTGAQAAQSSTAKNAITVSSGKQELSLSADKKYYETDLLSIAITTAPNTTFSGFNFTVKSQDYETTVVDENGNQITDLSSLTDKKFRIRIDASKLPAGSSTSITGDFAGIFTHSSFLAYKYNDESQTALLATNASTEKNVSLKFNVTVPDTGVDYSQYIYMIGAMILVIGIAVIYVNAKQEQN